MADAGSPPTRADPGTAVEDAILERFAPEPTEPTVPDTRVVAGHVTDGTGSPLQAVQVFVEGTAIGTLTDAQGAFRLELPRGARADDPPPILVAQRIGYDGASREVIAGPGGTAVLDFSLSEQALSLDEIVVTGTSSAVRDRAVPGELTGASSASEAVRPEVTPEVVPGAEVTVGTETWTPRTRADAEALAGFAILTLPDRPIEDVAADVVDGVWVTRVAQRLEDGTAVVLLQSRRVIRAGEGLLVGGMATASSSRGEFFLMAIGAASTESLGVVLERAR